MLIPVAVMGSGEPGEPFNGGTITEPLLINTPGTNDAPLNITSADGANAIIYAYDGGGLLGLSYSKTAGLILGSADDGSNIFQVGPTGAVTISPSDPAAIGLAIHGAGPSEDDATLLDVWNDEASVFSVLAAGDVTTHLKEDWSQFRIEDEVGALLVANGAGYLIITARAGVTVGGDIGFFNNSPVSQPAAPTTAQEFYDGIATLGLIAAGGTITDEPFNGGEITDSLRILPIEEDGSWPALMVDGQGFYDSNLLFLIKNGGFPQLFLVRSDGGVAINAQDPAEAALSITSESSDSLLEIGATVGIDLHASKIGFFGTTPVVKPTGVAVSAAGIHAALVTLGLIAA